MDPRVRLLVPALLIATAFAGCLAEDPAPAPVAPRPTEFPALATRPVFTLTGNLTADTPRDPSGGAIVVKREAYAFDAGNATLYWLPKVHRPSPLTTLFVHVTGTTTYADGNITEFDDVRTFQNANFVANYLIEDRAEAVRFTPRAGCDGCPPQVDVDGVTLDPGEHVDRNVTLVVGDTTYTGTLRFANHGLWTVKRIDECTRFEGCAAIPTPAPAGA